MTNLLSWKDLVTTLMAGAVGWIAYAQVKGINIPMITNYRWATLVVGVIGLGMCIFGSNVNPAAGMDGIQKVLAGLGIAAFIAIIAGLIFGTKLLFLTTVGILLALWLLSTGRHAFA